MPQLILAILAIAIFAIGAAFMKVTDSLQKGAEKHPFQFTRAVMGAIGGYAVAKFFGLPYEFGITSGCAIASVIAGEIL